MKKEYLTPEEILDIDFDNNRDRSLVYFLFLSGARIGEALQVMPEDFKEEGDYIVVKLNTEKNKKEPMRFVPLIDDDNEFLSSVMDRVDDTKEGCTIWEFDRTTAWKICKKWYGYGPHMLRHSRITFLAKEKDFKENLLTQFAGWTDTRPSVIYVHLNSKDIADKMKVK